MKQLTVATAFLVIGLFSLDAHAQFAISPDTGST